jgi:hypothetical protein
VQCLRVLHMCHCKLEAVPLELPLLRGLFHLHLSGNLIYDLPSMMCSLSRLETLDLRCNRIHFMPRVVTALTSLTSLDISENSNLQFDHTAVSVAGMPRLRSFLFPRPCESFSWTAAAVRSASAAVVVAPDAMDVCDEACTVVLIMLCVH